MLHEREHERNKNLHLTIVMDYWVQRVLLEPLSHIMLLILEWLVQES